jgi:hypothetical protein
LIPVFERSVFVGRRRGAGQPWKPRFGRSLALPDRVSRSPHPDGEGIVFRQHTPAER